MSRKFLFGAATAAGVIVMSQWLFSAQPGQEAGIIKAKRIEIVNDKGQTQFTLTTSPDGTAGIFFPDPNQYNIFIGKTKNNQWTVSLEGQQHLCTIMVENDKALMQLKDTKTGAVAGLLDRDGKGELIIKDKDNKTKRVFAE
jgi:hypothetical protein